MTQEEWIDMLKKDGVKDVTVVDMEPGEKGEHTHDETTIHVILQGDLTVKDASGEKTYRPQEYIEFPSGTTHSVIFGPQGLRMLVGTK